jgi:hypothetical protein
MKSFPIVLITVGLVFLTSCVSSQQKEYELSQQQETARLQARRTNELAGANQATANEAKPSEEDPMAYLAQKRPKYEARWFKDRPTVGILVPIGTQWAREF